ncbi:unnamed protein product, partial [Ectocarpus sp. 12 AP-2014]
MRATSRSLPLSETFSFSCQLSYAYKIHLFRCGARACVEWRHSVRYYRMSSEVSPEEHEAGGLLFLYFRLCYNAQHTYILGMELSQEDNKCSLKNYLVKTIKVRRIASCRGQRKAID